MTQEKKQDKEKATLKEDMFEGSLIPEAERNLMDGPHIIGGGDPNLSPDAGKPMV